MGVTGGVKRSQGNSKDFHASGIPGSFVGVPKIVRLGFRGFLRSLSGVPGNFTSVQGYSKGFQRVSWMFEGVSEVGDPPEVFKGCQGRSSWFNMLLEPFRCAPWCFRRVSGTFKGVPDDSIELFGCSRKLSRGFQGVPRAFKGVS